MMTPSMTSRDRERSRSWSQYLSGPLFRKRLEIDSVLTGHHLPPQPYMKAVKNSLGRYMHSLSAF